MTDEKEKQRGSELQDLHTEQRREKQTERKDTSDPADPADRGTANRETAKDVDTVRGHDTSQSVRHSG